MIGIGELKGIAVDIKQMPSAKKSSGLKLKDISLEEIEKSEQKSILKSGDGFAEKTEKTEQKSSVMEEELNQEKFEEILAIAQQTIFGSDTHYEFKLHEKTNTMMCKLVDNETDEIVKEIPSEKILDMVAGIWELVGIIVDEKA